MPELSGPLPRRSNADPIVPLARDVYDATTTLNAAWASLQAEVNTRRDGTLAADQAICDALDAAADTSDRKAAQAQVDKVIAPKRTDTERKARDIVAGRRPVR